MHLHTHSPAAPTSGSLIRWAAFYDLFAAITSLGRERRLREATVDLAGLRAGDQVLEVGCGTGAVALTARRLLGSTGAVSGIDPSPEMIAVARRKAAQSGLVVDFRVGVVEALPLVDGAVDVVLSSLMMHHLPAELKQRAMIEIRRVLKPGGRLVVVDFKRPAGFWGHLALGSVWHGALREGVEDLVPVIRRADFVDVDTGDTPLGMLGYVRARVETA